MARYTGRCAPPHTAHGSFADLAGEINDILRKPSEKFQFGKKSAKVYHF
jgi:hypothetical protein